MDKDGQPLRPPVIVRFSSSARDRRDEIIKRRKQLKGSGIVIYEDLTERNQKLLNRLFNNDNIQMPGQ